jgi:hypothetical protein
LKEPLLDAFRPVGEVGCETLVVEEGVEIVQAV